MQKNNRESILIYASVALMLVVYVLGLFIDVTRDGAKYAYIAKEMIETGNWIDLKIQGENYEQKPHLTFWLSAVSFLIFGVTNFAFKLPILLYSLAGFYATARLGQALFGKQVGRTAGLMSLFSVIMVLYNMDIHTDILLYSNVAFSLWLLYEYLQNKKLGYALGASVAMGLAMLTKGPFGVVVPFFAVIGYLVTTRQFKQLLNPVWILVVIVAFAVASPALINLYRHWGWQGIGFFIWENNMGRVTGKYLGNTPDPTFYIHNLLYLFLPWSVSLFSGAWLSVNKLIKKKLTPADKYLFWTFWILFVTLSASRSKLPNYIMVLMPVAAVWAANTWHTYFDGKTKFTGFANRLAIAQWVSIAVLWILPIAALILLSPKPSITLLVVPTALLVGTWFLAKSLERGKRLFAVSAVALMTFSAVMNLEIAPALFGQQGQPQAAQFLNEKVQSGEQVYHFNTRVAIAKQNGGIDPRGNNRPIPIERHASLNYELMFYCNHPVTALLSFDELAEINGLKGVWIYTDEDGAKLLNGWMGIDEVFTFEHLDMRRAGKYINPKLRNSSIEKMYLFHANLYPINCQALNTTE